MEEERRSQTIVRWNCCHFKCTRKKEGIVIDTPSLKDSFKGNSMWFDYSLKSTVNAPELLP